MRLPTLILAVLLIVTLYAHALESPASAGDGTIAQFQRDAWWLSSYKSLATKLTELPDRTWEFALDRSHPEESGTMRLSREESGALLLLSRYKQPAIYPDTGRPVREGLLIDVVMRIRDKNLDGIPDEFRGEPFHPCPDEQVLANGFIKIRDHADHAAILVQWDTFVGLATKALVETNK